MPFYEQEFDTRFSIDTGYSKRRRPIDMLEELAERYWDFEYYKDTTYRNLARPAVFWPVRDYVSLIRVFKKEIDTVQSSGAR